MEASFGVSAGIDMTLILAYTISGEKFAQTVHLEIEYDPHPPFDVGSPEKVDPALCEALRNCMTTRFETINESERHSGFI